MLWRNDNDKRCLHTERSYLVGKLGGVFLFSDGEKTSTAGVVEVTYGHSITRKNIKSKLESPTWGSKDQLQ